MSNPLFIKAPFLTRKNFFNTNKTNNIGAIFTNGSYGISNKLNYVITVFKSRTKVSFYI